jgi:hypothetical protein
MKIVVCFTTLLIVSIFSGFAGFSGLAVAQTLDLDLKAGSSSLTGSINVRQHLNRGYLKYGASGMYFDYDATEFRWGALQVMVGNDTLWPGFWAEFGFKGLYGSAEKRIYSGDIGAVAFTGRLGYSTPLGTLPIPLDIIGEISYAPDPLTFMDTDTFSEASLGVGIGIIEQATLEISYHIFDIEMEQGPGSWNIEESALFLGLSLHF